MKKFLLVALLCITPLFVSHAAELTVEDCVKWTSYYRVGPPAENEPEVAFEDLPKLLQKTITVQNNIQKWVSKEKITKLDKSLEEGFTACEKAIAEKENANGESDKTKKRSYEDATKRFLNRATLTLQKVLADYKVLESRNRMPFVHHGNILPGPSEEENGSIYVEQKFIPKFINGTLIFLMSLSILMVIIGGLMFIFSSGDSDMTSRAKTTIMWAIVGVVITLLSYAIVQFIIGIDFTL